MKKHMWLLVLLLASPCLASDDTHRNDPRVATALGLLVAWADAKAAYEDIPGVSMAVVHDQRTAS